MSSTSSRNLHLLTVYQSKQNKNVKIFTCNIRPFLKRITDLSNYRALRICILAKTEKHLILQQKINKTQDNLLNRIMCYSRNHPKEG